MLLSFFSRSFRAVILFVAASTAHAQEVTNAETALEFVRTYCVDCHQGEEAESGLRLDRFDSGLDISGALKTWKKVIVRVRDRTMPPQDSEQPADAHRSTFVEFLRDRIQEVVCAEGPQPGPPRLRRLNRTEYANTVRDLLKIHVNAGHALPVDGAGGEGFDNATETLFISPIYAEKYIEAAQSALGHALKDPESRDEILIAEPSKRRSPAQAAQKVLEAFLRRAFRRPVAEQEVDEYVALFEEAYAQEGSYESAIGFALQAAMVSPKFLMLYETSNETDQPALLQQHEMASRLSYFLWASMPDDELLEVADKGKLHDPDVLAEQVARMLYSRIDRRGLRRGAKVRGFAASFIEQWLGTRALGREFKPDPRVASRYNSELEGGLKYEPIFFFEDILSENRSLLNFIDSDFTYVNRALARHYRIRGEFREQPKRVDLEEKHHRGGLLSMGAVLAVSSHPYRTSPVLRGKWILETMLGTPPPPPPPDVPPLEESEEGSEPLSLREKLEVHRADPTCATCHDMIDPLGFGLDNYDVLGRWRTEADDKPVDARGVLPDGSSFDGPDELKALLLERRGQFIRHLTSKILGYALSRELTEKDDCVIEEIVAKLAQDDYQAHTLITEIVMSVPFRYKSPRPPAQAPAHE